MLGFVQKQQVV